MDRESHRAAVEAGYASLNEYIETWRDSPIELMDRLKNKPPTYEDAIAAVRRIEFLCASLLQIKAESNEENIRSIAHMAVIGAIKDDRS